MWSFASGVFALIVFETLTRGDAPARVGGLIDLVNVTAKKLLDPTVPAIADHRDGQPPGGWGAGAVANVTAGVTAGVSQAQRDLGAAAAAARNGTPYNPPTRKDPPLS